MNNIILTTQDILKILPHRYPFLMIDKVTDWKSYDYIHAWKNITINEPFFQGHFPSRPVMPGVLIVEALAQAAGVLAYLSDNKNHEDHLFYLALIENAKFRKMVLPGDTLKLDVHFKVSKNRFVKVTGNAYVEDQLVCSADLMSAKGT
jgi:3-hydroxyacyl-[acyl-carrier-protein] dehydratase